MKRCLIYWDTQDPKNQGWAYRTDRDSGPVDDREDIRQLSDKYTLSAHNGDIDQIFEEFGFYPEVI